MKNENKEKEAGNGPFKKQMVRISLDRGSITDTFFCVFSRVFK